MKKRFFLLFLVGCVLMSCHSKLDLTDVDTTGQVDMGMVLPVGTLRMTLGDFIGNGEIDRITVDENGLFHFKDKVDIPEKPYHSIDIRSYIIKNQATANFNIDQFIPSGTQIVGDGQHVYELPFDLELDLTGINNDTAEERIDSIWVTKSLFYSTIHTENFDINWNEIRSVKLVLDPEQFRPNDGNDTLDIPISNKDFNVKIDIPVNNFTINLMKDKRYPILGSVNKVKFKVLFNVCPAYGHMIDVYANSRFTYDMEVAMIDYKALWGYFQAGSETRDTRKIDMDSLWDGWKDLKKLKVHFADPKISVSLTHSIAAPLSVHVNYLYALDTLGNPAHATWDGEYETDITLNKFISPETYTIGQSITNTHDFTKDPSHGHLDSLFEVRPDSFYYSYYMFVDNRRSYTDRYKQHRIVKEDSLIYGEAIIDLPFDFNPGSEAEYSTTIDDVNLEKLTLDSLLDDVDQLDSVKEGSLKCGIKIKSAIPFIIDGLFSFLDKDGKDMDLDFVKDQINNHITIPAAKLRQPYDMLPDTAVTDIILNVNKEDFERLSEVKSIRMNALLKDNPENKMPFKLNKDASVSVKISIAAKIEALFNFGKKNK